MIRITDIHLPVDYKENDLLNKICKSLKINKNSIDKYTLFRRSIDARKKFDVHFIITVDVIVKGDENTVIAKAKCKNAQITKPYEYKIDTVNNITPPVIVGAGPAGLFAGLILALSGAKPIIIERGCDVDK